RVSNAARSPARTRATSACSRARSPADSHAATAAGATETWRIQANRYDETRALSIHDPFTPSGHAGLLTAMVGSSRTIYFADLDSVHDRSSVSRTRRI